MNHKNYGYIANKMYKKYHRFDWLKANYDILIGLTFLFLIGLAFVWNEYRIETNRQLWMAELQETKKQAVWAERECGKEMWEEVKKNFR